MEKYRKNIHFRTLDQKSSGSSPDRTTENQPLTSFCEWFFCSTCGRLDHIQPVLITIKDLFIYQRINFGIRWSF